MSTPDYNARSPWASLTNIREVIINPSNEIIDGELMIPGSKSFTNRALIIAALAEGASTLKGILKSDDSFWCIETLKKLGIEIEIVDEDTVKIEGVNGNWPINEGEIYIGAAGTIARFLPGALGINSESDYIIKASKRLSERPITTLIEALNDLGMNIEYLEKNGQFPIQIKPSKFKGGQVYVSGNTSSQFISGLLICSSYAKETVTIKIKDFIVQHAYVQLTIDLLKEFGVDVEVNESFKEFRIHPSNYKGITLDLEADASTASYFMSLAALNGGKVRITNLNLNTQQPDIGILDILEKMGCSINKTEHYVEVSGPKQLKGGFVFDMKELSDQALTIAALAPFADDKITINNVEHIRTHESDRIKVMTEALLKLGAKVKEHRDGWELWPSKLNGTTLLTHDDHRVAMSLALIGTKIGNVKLIDPGCVSKTCPQFFNMLEKFKIDVNYVSE